MARLSITVIAGRGVRVRDEWSEGQHPRADNGKFGSGGGGGGGAAAAKTKVSVGELKKKLEAMPHAKLVAALKNSSVDPAVKKHIEKELDSRADRGTQKGHGER